MATPTADTYTVPSGTAVVYAGMTAPSGGGSAIPAGMAPTVIQAGDSITASDVWTPHRWHLGRKNAPFEVVLNCGFNGQSVVGLRDQLRDNSWTRESAPGLVGAPSVGLAQLRIGTNNARTNAVINSTSEDLYRDIITRLLAKAQYVAVYPLPPVGGVTQTAVPNIAGWNAFLATLPSEFPGQVFYVDDVSDLDDISGNIVPSYYDTSDEVHPGGAGQIRMMQTAAAAHDALFSQQTFVNPLDPAASGNVLSNSAMAGSSGTLGSGWTGQVITGGALTSQGAGVSGTASIVAADAGDPITMPWQRITPTSFGVNTFAQLALPCSPVAFTSGYPARLEHVFQVRFNAVDGTKIHRVRFLLVAGGQTINGESWIKVNGRAGVDQTMTYRCTRVRSGASTGVTGTQTPTAYFCINSDAGGSGSMGSIDIRCPIIAIKD